MQNIYFLYLKVHINRKFSLCSYKLSPLKYTIPKFETFWVKIGDVRRSKLRYFALKNGLQIARSKCHVMLVARSVQYPVWRLFSMYYNFLLEAFQMARHRLSIGAARAH